MIAYVYGAKVRVCHAGCRDAFRSDRKHGAIYLSVRAPEGTYTAEQFSLLSGWCAYCSRLVTSRPRLRPTPAWSRA